MNFIDSHAAQTKVEWFDKARSPCEIIMHHDGRGARPLLSGDKCIMVSGNLHALAVVVVAIACTVRPCTMFYDI